MEEQLFQAIRKGNLDEVNKLIKKGVNVRTEKNLPIQWAVNYDNFEIFKCLAKHGANIHFKEDDVIVIAAHNGNLKIIKFCVKRGGSIHTQRNAALSRAILMGQIHVIEYLIKKGINLRIYGKTDLYNLANSLCNLYLTKLVMRKGENFNGIRINKPNRTPKYWKMCKLFRQKGKIQKKKYSWESLSSIWTFTSISISVVPSLPKNFW